MTERRGSELRAQRLNREMGPFAWFIVGVVVGLLLWWALS